MAAALLVALGAGLVLALMLPAATLVPGWQVDAAGLAQAHGWAQLQGWLGIFVAGMALRLIPRLCGRRPLPYPLTLGALGLLVVGVVGRVVAQTVAGRAAAPLFLGVSLAAAMGMALVAAGLLLTLVCSRRGGQSWRWPAWAAACWWAIWGGLTVAMGLQGAEHGALVPNWLDAPATWVVLLGPLLNAVWAVQARSVPVFFGRPPPRRLWIPTSLFNLGGLLVLLSILGDSSPLRSAGLALSGLTILWLIPLVGAVRGRAHRLSASARPTGRFVISANLWGMVGGTCLLLGAVLSLPLGSTDWPPRLEIGALHALGLGMATLLIVGMSQLVAPVFAIQRAAVRPAVCAPDAILAALVGATACRLAAALLDGLTTEIQTATLLGISGVLAWLGLALFARGFAVAWWLQGRTKRSLVRRARARP